MKIILAIPSLETGGAESLVIDLANELSLNSKIQLISIKSIDNYKLSKKNLNERITIKSLDKKKGFDIRIVWKLFIALKNYNPDVVHIHLNMCLIYFLPIIPLFKKIKFVFSIHSSFENHESFFKKLNKLYFYKRVKNICLTTSIHNKFSTNFPQLDFYKIENGIKKNTSFSNGYVLDELSVYKGKFKKTFVFVGRLSHAKNIPLLLDVFKDEFFSEIKLLIIGDGDNNLKIKINEISKITKNRIQYLGEKSNVLEYMNMADALILTSRHEGLPVVILEALSLGLPIISTPVGGTPDILINLRNGILSKGFEKNDMRRAVEEFIRMDKDKIDKIKKNNIRDFNDKFSIQICALNHLNLYNKL